MQIKSPKRVLNLDKPSIMGILNVTPDSFSDGGKWNSLKNALDHAKAMEEEGALIIDIGGESTRPGAKTVSVNEELDRVIPVVENLRKQTDLMISIDTSQVEVIKEAVKAGADIWNDIRALTNENAIETAASLNIPVILMHMQGNPATMQDHPHYEDPLKEVIAFLNSRIDACLKGGIKKENIILDPGFGFGKTVKDNYILLDNLDKIVALGYPVLSALSRKSMIGAACTIEDPQKRVTGSVAGALISVLKGAQMLRVHDVKETVEALNVYKAMIESRL